MWLTQDHPESYFLALAASAEQGSEHPLGESIIRSATDQGCHCQIHRGFESIAGHGIKATVAGHQVMVGNRRLMEREQVALNGLETRADELQQQAKTAMWLAVDGQASAIIGVADTIKEGSREAIQAMHEQGLVRGHDDGR